MDWIIGLAIARAVLWWKLPGRDASNSFLIWATNMMLFFMLLGAVWAYFDWPLFGAAEQGDWRQGY